MHQEKGLPMDWSKNGVKIVHAEELDMNTPQTSGMMRAAAITHAPRSRGAHREQQRARREELVPMTTLQFLETRFPLGISATRYEIEDHEKCLQPAVLSVGRSQARSFSRWGSPSRTQGSLRGRL